MTRSIKPELVLVALGLIICAVMVLYQGLSSESIELRSGEISASQTMPQSAKSRYAVDINAADRLELLGVRYISPAIADAILEYRAENGRFLREEDLLLVDGIGEATLRKLEPYIRVG